MPTPYRDAPAPAGPGLADQDRNRTITGGVIGCIAALVVGLSAMICVPLGVIGLLMRSEGNPAWVVFFGIAAGAPCLVAFIFVASAPLVLLQRKLIGGTDGGVLDRYVERLGGEVIKPAIAPAALRTEIDGERVRLVAQALQRSAQSALFMSLIEQPWAKTGAAELFGGLRVRLTMYTNQRAPYRLALVSRTGMSGLGAGFAKMQEVRLPAPVGERIACYADDPQRAYAALADPQLVEAIRAVVESNLPYVTQLSFSPEGASWASLATSQTEPDALIWRLRQMGWIAQRLAG